MREPSLSHVMPWAKAAIPAQPTNPQKEEIERSAFFSEDRVYRYWLKREFLGVKNAGNPLRLCVWMNPSTADDKEDDASIRVGMSFARAWGDGGILVINVLDLVLTDSTKLPMHKADALGPRHWEIVDEALRHNIGIVQDEVFCGWGDKAAGEEANELVKRIRAMRLKPCAIALTKRKNPSHPLRKRLDLPLVEF